MQINRYTAFAIEIEHEVFVVEVRDTKHRIWQHNGPRDVAFFTREQAERLVRMVVEAGKINPEHWSK